jgi:hypothetical protein
MLLMNFGKTKGTIDLIALEINKGLLWMIYG